MHVFIKFVLNILLVFNINVLNMFFDRCINWVVIQKSLKIVNALKLNLEKEITCMEEKIYKCILTKRQKQ